MQKRALTTLACGFTVSALLMGSPNTAMAADKPPANHSAPNVTYLVDTDRHGGKIYFTPYEQLPAAWQNLLNKCSSVQDYQAENGKILYEKMTPYERAGLLNILTKATATLLPNGTTVFEHFLKVRELKQDRIFVDTDSSLNDEMVAGAAQGRFMRLGRMDGLFHRHHSGASDNREGLIVGNYKTHDRHGGLQVLERKIGLKSTDEIDIDEEKPGLMHLLRAMKHTLLRQRTNPFVIRRIMEKRQSLPPPYWTAHPRREAGNPFYTVADSQTPAPLHPRP